MELNKIYHGECLKIMKNHIPNQSIDMILCDLPYGVTSCLWDSIIPIDQLWEQYRRIIKNCGVIALTATQPFTTDLINEARDLFKYEYSWINESRPTGFIHAKNKPLTTHENVLIFSKGAIAHQGRSNNRMTYNPQMKAGKPYVRNGSGEKRFGSIAGKRPSHDPNYISKNDGFRYPTSVLKYNKGNQGSLHPSQKPVALFECLIRTYTHDGEIVLDNCIGSGTTAIAAIRSGRNWIGIEQLPNPSKPVSKDNPDYISLANQRIADEIAHPILPCLVKDQKPKPEIKQTSMLDLRD